MTATLTPTKPSVGGLGCKHCVFWELVKTNPGEAAPSGLLWGQCMSSKLPDFLKFKQQMSDITQEDKTKVKIINGKYYTTSSYGCPYRKTKE